MGSAMQSLYSANPPKQPGQQNQPSWGGGNQQVQKPPTFSTMQQSGQPRPAPPPSWYNYQPGSSPSNSPGQSQGYRPPQGPPQPSYGTQPPQGGGMQRPPWAQGNYQTDQGYAPPPAPYAPSAGGAPPAPQPPNAGGGFPSNPGMGQQTYYGGGGGSPPSNPQTGYNQPVPPQSWTPPPQAPPQGMSAAPQQYGSGPAATSQTQNTANQLGSATQNLLLGQLQNPNGAMGSPAAQNLLQQQLANPNPLGSQAFQTQMQQAQTGINENMAQQTDAINSNLASRGVYDSSLASGYLQDLSTSAGRQMASIGANLLPQEAALQLQGTNSALGNAQSYSGQNTSNISNALANSLGYGQNQFSQQYNTAQMNLLQQAQQNGQLQQMLGLTST